MRTSFFISFLCATISCTAAAAYDIIPAPVSVQKGELLTKKLDIISSKPIESCDKSHAEAYRIDITQEGVHLSWANEQARHYAMASLAQLQDELRAHSGGIPTGVIIDYPQYEWRGYMIDVARHYMPVDEMKELIAELARYKFNKFHIHLTDDNGWRFDVPGYPKMVSIASKRRESFGNGIPEGGYYTREDLKEIIDYCAQHGMEVIPEMDAPGHSQALAAAYPEFFCDVAEAEVRTGETGPNGRIYLTCPAKKDLWVFYDAAVKELASIFPSSYIHVGGDEAPTKSWDSCPDCAKLRDAHGQKDGSDQMRDFLAQLAAIVTKHGKKPMYWYELDDKLYREGEVVHTWYANKTEQAAKAAQKKNLKLIISPSTYFYLDFPQIAGQRNYNWMPDMTLETAYSFKPEKYRGYSEVLGMQCNLWTERVPNQEHVFYQSFPRAMATAEISWSPASRRDWKSFQSRVEAQKKPYEQRTGYTLERTKENQPALNQVYPANSSVD